MGSSVLKWLASLGTGVLSVVLLYLQTHVGDASTTRIEGVDPLISFVLISLVTKGVTWAVSHFGGSVAGPTSSGYGK
jgi:hypothetical protein